MPFTFDEAFARVNQLVADFKANEKFYLSPQYQEAEARRDFIDKFLIAFGWDVNHETQKNPYEQEVKVERKEHGISQRRADYAFYLAPNFRDVKFYIEAKKPFGEIATPDNYFQTIRYGWNSRTPIAALFDFEQFEIVDWRFKPDLETALQRNLKKFHYSQFTDKEKFAEIYWLFSREAIANGSLEKYSETLPKKRGAVQRGLFKGGYQSIDDSFLEELDAHRDTLAHIFKNNNPKLDGESLTEAVQRTLDRLVFIRFLEDKLIEPQYLVAKFGERGSAWGDFIATSKRLDGIYNGIVFKKNDILDSPAFKVDDEQFSGICEALCHINSSYDFNAIPIHILGSIYERFLGKVIVATDRRARVEEKPKVRNAGGIFYTPEYIVRYIVENTVGKLIEGKIPAQIAEMKFADIACGSGSFLLGVYDLLIRYHTKFYNENPRKAKKGDVMQREDGLHLSLQKKREILVSNIYGVDIDNQAVEVAQLSLYLKLLQDETPGSTRQYFLDFEQQALLPSLNRNIVCGNSLIGRDVIVADLFESGETERKLNPMNFEDAFPEIMKRGGFNAIVGNPPYVDIKGLPKIQTDYIFEHYACANNRINLFAAFIERGLKFCQHKGLRFSFIIPTAMLTQESYKVLRKAIVEKYHVVSIARLPNESFGRAAGEVKVDTMIMVLDDQLGNGSTVEILGYAGYDKIVEINPKIAIVHTVIPQSIWAQDNNFLWSLNLPTTHSKLINKIEANSVALEDCAEFCLGLTPYDKYKGHTRRQIEDQVFHADYRKDKTFKKLLSGNDVMRYLVEWNGKRWISYGNWLGAPREQRFFTEKRILIKQIIDWSSKRIWAALTTDELYNSQNAFNLIARPGWSTAFLLGVINSRLITFYHSKKFLDEFKMRFQNILIKDCRCFPIPKIDFSKTADKARHDKIDLLVEQMLEAKKLLANAQSDKDKYFYESKCAALDRQIDALVYDLYRLTAEEIKFVEEVAK